MCGYISIVYMFNISQYLEKFKKVGFKEREQKETFLAIVKLYAGFEPPYESLKIKGFNLDTR